MPHEVPGGLRPDRAAGFLKALGVEVRARHPERATPAASTTPPLAWLLQRSPDRFDLDSYLVTTRDILWPATRCASKFAPGQTVYLWRNRGSRRRCAPGVVAVGVTTGSAQMRPDYNGALAYWADPEEGSEPALRVPIQVLELATKNPMLGAERLRADAVCADLPHLARAVRNSYRLEPRHAERLARLGYLPNLRQLSSGLTQFSDQPGIPDAQAVIAPARLRSTACHRHYERSQLA